MQFGGPAPVVGVIYGTTLSRPDAALSLALLYGLEGKREARVASIALSETGLGSAIFADAVFRFYQLGPVPNANRSLPVGLAADKPLPPDSAAVKAAMQRVKETGEPAYKQGIRRVTDTAEVTALMRNSLTYFPDGMVAVVLGAPATYLAKMLDYPGTAELVKAKVKVLVLCQGQQDPAALRRILAEWPSPIVFCDRALGQALSYPGATLEKDFAWTKEHPVADFYRAAQPMPYDAPCQDPAAILYATKPDNGFFQTSESGTIAVNEAGEVSFASNPAGKNRRLAIVAGQQAAIVAALREWVAAKPVPPPQRRRFTTEELEKFRLQREEEQRKRDLQEKKAAKPSND